MRSFEYRGFDRAGQVRKGFIEAADVKDARVRLAAMGVMAETLEGAGERRGGLGSRRSARSRAEFRAFLYHELSAMLGAGLPVMNALQMLLESPECSREHAALARVRDSVREGGGIGAAIAGSGLGTRPMEEALIEAGERSGSLAATLGKLATFLYDEQDFGDRVRAALVYPGVILVFAAAVAIVMLGFVIPSAVRLLEDARVSLPLLTRAMAGAGRVLLWGVLPVLAALAIVYARWFRAVSRDPVRRARLDSHRFRLPVLGSAATMLVSLRFARTLAILLDGGVPLTDAMETAGRATGSAWIVHLMAREAEAVRHGSSLADAIRRIPPLAGSLPLWIQTGEAGGSLAGMLHHAADRYQQHWSRFMTRVLGLLEPVLIALLGAFVLLVALSILLPVVSMNRSLI